MSEEDYEGCRKDAKMKPFCDGYREATRLGDPTKCPKGMIEGFCRAVVALDKSQCVAVGGIEDKEQGKAACEKIIDRSNHLAKGLKELVTSGSASERELAKAALGQADACKTYEKDAMTACQGLTVSPAKPATGDPTTKPPPEPDPGSSGPKS